MVVLVVGFVGGGGGGGRGRSAGVGMVVAWWVGGWVGGWVGWGEENEAVRMSYCELGFGWVGAYIQMTECAGVNQVGWVSGWVGERLTSFSSSSSSSSTYPNVQVTECSRVSGRTEVGG